MSAAPYSFFSCTDEQSFGSAAGWTGGRQFSSPKSNLWSLAAKDSGMDANNEHNYRFRGYDYRMISVALIPKFDKWSF